MANLVNVNSRKKGQKTPFSTAKDVGNLCRYVVGESGKHDSSEILSYGGYGVTVDAGIQTAINQILTVQKYNGIASRGGRRMVHMCLNITEEEFCSLGCNEELLIDYFSDCAGIVFDEGHQVVYGDHLNKNKDQSGNDDGKSHAFAHLHIAGNSINYNNSLKYHRTKEETLKLEAEMNNILEEYKSRSAVGFSNADVWRKRRQ
jgi:hypothetical protein